MIQTLPSVMLGVYSRWFNDWVLLVGWAVGTVVGTWMFIAAKQIRAIAESAHHSTRCLRSSVCP
jgi:Na+/proline symporter